VNRLRFLIVEDSEDDMLLVLRALGQGGFDPDFERVWSEEGLRSALNREEWDAVVADHSMPNLDSIEVIRIVKEYDADLPVIIVSGSIGEEVAVGAMKSGAQDYVMKGNLARLVPALERAIRDAEIRRAHRKAEATIRHMAFHDALTGLVNRFEFEERLKNAMHEAKSNDQALLYLDLDQFKLINDTCGHAAGDELLKQLAMLLRKQIRDADTLGRLGGDEFGILLLNCPVHDAVEVSEKLLKAINEFRFVWNGKSFTVGGSIGLVPISASMTNPADALRAADVACYAAKEQGRNRLYVFRSDDADLLRSRGEMEWAMRIRQALDEDRFVLWSQKIVRVNSDCVLPRDELLLRMIDESGNLIPPGIFIPAAERFSLMPMLDRWVVRHAVNLVANSSDEGISFVNLSGASLSDETFYQYISDTIAEGCIQPERLCFEITETAAISNLKRAVSFIGKIRSMGCHFALDDFGSGMSSFSYLKAIPVDYLKMDGGFVKGVADDPMDRAIVEAINRIGHVAGLKTIAEFVESQEIMDALRAIGVDYAQGYHIHRPEAVQLRD
jgi:diguanylate cyclase (GGDEF)-like protein